MLRRHRILVVSHDQTLRETRATLLKKQGYTVETAANAEDALISLSRSKFDLAIVGRDSLSTEIQVEQHLREKYPRLLILKVGTLTDQFSPSASFTIYSGPGNLLTALHAMLGQPN